MLNVIAPVAFALASLPGSSNNPSNKVLQFRPFSEVHNVCPSCEVNKYDGIQLNDKRTIRAWIVAENAIFYLLERHGEYRALDKKLVKNVMLSRYRDGSERKGQLKKNPDQIVFLDGHVVSGTIENINEDTEWYTLKSSERFVYSASGKQIMLVVREGNVKFLFKQ